MIVLCSIFHLYTLEANGFLWVVARRRLIQLFLEVGVIKCFLFMRSDFHNWRFCYSASGFIQFGKTASSWKRKKEDIPFCDVIQRPPHFLYFRFGIPDAISFIFCCYSFLFFSATENRPLLFNWFQRKQKKALSLSCLVDKSFDYSKM